ARQQFGGGADRRGRDRACQGDARRPRLGLIGQRHGAASRARNVQASRRHQAQSHPVSRRRPSAQRSHRRAGGILLFPPPPPAPPPSRPPPPTPPPHPPPAPSR